jgi:methylenetetrahydrofolate reductase (NADPH)
MKDEQSFVPKIDNFAVDLVQQIKLLNEVMHDVMHVDNKADFCIGVAGYPEKHLESPSLLSDLKG